MSDPVGDRPLDHPLDLPLELPRREPRDARGDARAEVELRLPVGHEPAPDPRAREAEWVARVRGGDAAAFQALFGAHHAALCTFAHHQVGLADVAEDLVQDVFVYVWEHRAGWEVRGSVRAYLLAAVRNAATSWLRHQRVVERRAAETVALFDQPRAGADRELAAAETTRVVRAAIARLPERCRAVFTLHREQGLSYAEVAGVLGISAKTVDAQMGRALKALRKQLGGYWP